MDDLDILTLAEAAELLDRSPATLRNQVKAGQLRARLIGKTWITTTAEVDRYRREHLGRVGRPANLLEPTKAPFEDVIGKPGDANILRDRPRR